jgi:hypothetical protein
MNELLIDAKLILKKLNEPKWSLPDRLEFANPFFYNLTTLIIVETDMLVIESLVEAERYIRNNLLLEEPTESEHQAIAGEFLAKIIKMDTDYKIGRLDIITLNKMLYDYEELYGEWENMPSYIHKPEDGVIIAINDVALDAHNHIEDIQNRVGEIFYIFEAEYESIIQLMESYLRINSRVITTDIIVERLKGTNGNIFYLANKKLLQDFKRMLFNRLKKNAELYKILGKNDLNTILEFLDDSDYREMLMWIIDQEKTNKHCKNILVGV